MLYGEELFIFVCDRTILRANTGKLYYRVYLWYKPSRFGIQNGEGKWRKVYVTDGSGIPTFLLSFPLFPCPP